MKRGLKIYSLIRFINENKKNTQRKQEEFKSEPSMTTQDETEELLPKIEGKQTFGYIITI